MVAVGIDMTAISKAYRGPAIPLPVQRTLIAD
jgi:hypothetical protein